jgi:hypothetical protein
MEFQELRRRLINQLKTDPHSVLVAKSFQERLLDRLQPRSLYCSPKGNLKMSQGFEAMFSYDHARSQPEVTSPVAKWVWVMTEAKSPWYEDESAFLLRRPEWMTFISDTAPIAKLLADGRHRRDMLGCESTHAEARLRTVLDMEVDIDPLFQSPDDQFDLSAYLYLIGKSDAPCDLSGARVNAASGTMFSKWELLNKPEFVEAIIQFWARGWPSDAAAWMQFWKDWSPWIVAKEFSPANGIEAFRKALDELSARS